MESLFVQDCLEDGNTTPSQNARYRLTLLKKLSQSTKPTKIKERVADQVFLKQLYEGLESMLPVLNLGHEGIRYYANSVIKSDIFQLKQRSDGNPREFTQAEKEEQEIAESCNRLIKNSINCWNYLYLSHKLARTDSQENKSTLLTAIETHSVVSWAHINLLGEYDISDEKLKDSVGINLPKLAA